MALTAEEITSEIAVLGEKIKQAKIEKKTQEFWGEFLQSMLALKVRTFYVYIVLSQLHYFCFAPHRTSCSFIILSPNHLVSSRLVSNKTERM